MASAPNAEERANRTYSSAQTMVCEYYRSLNNVIARIEATEDKDAIQRDVFICFLLGIAIVETFISAYFQVFAEGNNNLEHKEKFYVAFNSRSMSFDKKINMWLKLFFSKEIDPNEPAAKEFSELKKKRNHLTHFKRTYSTLPFSGATTISGLADTTDYNNLTINDALQTRKTVENYVEYVFRLSGVPEENIPFMLQSWIGKFPYHLYE